MPAVNLIKTKGRMYNIGLESIVEGRVLKKKPREIFIEIPNIGVARVYGREYLKGKEIIAGLKEGDSVVIKIIGLDDGYGNFEAEILNAEQINDWALLKEYMATRKILQLPVKDINRGGLILEFRGINGFLPLSQLAPENYFRSANKTEIFRHLEKFKGKKMTVRVININPSLQKFILSERAAKEEIYHEILSKFNVGELVKVTVLGFSSFGIFVRFYENPPIDGLIHVSEIPDEYKNFDKIFKVGDKIEAKIIKIESDRVRLTLKNLQEDPWVTLAKKYNVGSIVEGVVIDKSSGFFATIETEGVKGVVLENFENLELGKSYRFKITQLIPNEGKLVLQLENES